MKVEHEAMTMRITNDCASVEVKPDLLDKVPSTMAEHIDDGYASSDGSNMILQKQQAPPQVLVVQPRYAISSSRKRFTTPTRILRPVSYPSAADNSLNSNEHSSRQLRALLLPDLVRAKGGRLISTSEIASLQRFRSVSDPMDYSSASGQSRGISYGHYRTISLPGLRYSADLEDDKLASSRLKPDATPEAQQGGRVQVMKMRDVDLDTFGEPGNLLLDADEYETFNPPMAGYVDSFRDYMYDDLDDCGGSSKPVVIVFRPNLSLVSPSYDGEEGDEEGEEDIMIEAWAVDGNGGDYSGAGRDTYSMMEHGHDAEYASFGQAMEEVFIVQMDDDRTIPLSMLPVYAYAC